MHERTRSIRLARRSARRGGPIRGPLALFAGVLGHHLRRNGSSGRDDEGASTIRAPGFRPLLSVSTLSEGRQAPDGCVRIPAEGKIVEDWVVGDEFGILQQLGHAPA